MRIFLTLSPSGNKSVPGSMTWYNNLYESMKDLGHDVFLLRLDSVAEKHSIQVRDKKFREVFSYELLKTFKREHVMNPFDLFFSYVTDYHVENSVLLELKKLSVPMVNFSCNNTHQFYLVKSISPIFDFNLHSEKDAAIKFKEINANPVWFPMAANPKYYFPVRGGFIYDVSFIGAAYAKRSYYVNHLVQNQIKVDCFGPNWLINKPYSKIKKIKKEANRMKWLLQSLVTFSPGKRAELSLMVHDYDRLVRLRKVNLDRFHYPVKDVEIPGIFSRSKINLGFLEVYSENSSQVVQSHLHLREFEVPMCGGLYLTNYSDELTEFYIPDKEVIMYHNEHELLDRVNYFLKHSDQADKIRKAAYIRAINCHTYQKRLNDLFEKLSLK